METRENAETPGNSERESIIQKLDEIEGIGRKTAEALYENGIHSYANLAQYLRQYSAKEISEALKKHGVNLGPGFIDKEKWIRSLHSKEEHTSPTLSEKETEVAKRSNDTRSSQKTRDHEIEFTVFFDFVRDQDGKPVLQTTVYNPRDSGEEKLFEGNEITPWVNWMLERANLPFALEPISTRVEGIGETQSAQEGVVVLPIPRKPFDTRLELGDVLISVVEPSPENPEKRLKAVFHLRLSGNDAEALASQSIPFRFQIYKIDLDKGVSGLVASSESWLEPNQLEYTHQIEFVIPDVGRYEFHSLVQVLLFGDLMADHWGPTMRVIP